MFENKKILKKIQSEKEELLILKEEIIKEKNELLRIKQIMEEKTPKIDINDVYDFYLDGIHTFVKQHVTNIEGTLLYGGARTYGYEITLKNIFDNSTVYQASQTSKLNRKEYVGYYIRNSKETIAYITPIHELDRNLLTYTDKQVPLYVLQQLYYQLNNVDINSPLLTPKQLIK